MAEDRPADDFVPDKEEGDDLMSRLHRRRKKMEEGKPREGREEMQGNGEKRDKDGFRDTTRDKAPEGFKQPK